MKKLFGMVCGVYIDNYWWCISRFLNGLYRMEVVTGIVEYVCDLPENNDGDMQAYIDMLHYEKKIFFIPAYAKDIAIYDIGKGDFKKIGLSDFYHNQSGFRVGGACIFKQWLFLYPCLSKVFVRINLNTQTVNMDEDFIRSNNLQGDIFAFHSRHYQENSIVYIPLASQDGVVCADIEKFELKIIDIDNEETGYSAVIKVKDELWLAPKRSGSIVKYCIKNKKTYRYSDYPINFKRNAELAFFNFFCFDENAIYLTPFSANMLLKINTVTGCICECKLELSEHNRTKYTMEDYSLINMHGAKVVEGKAYLMSELMNVLLIVNQKLETLELPFELLKSDKTDIRNMVIKELRGFSLKDFLGEIEEI